MKFCEFAEKLRPILNEGDNISAFTKTLFELIMDEETLSESPTSILDPYSEATFKSYFYGTTSINKIAKKIVSYMDTKVFEDYISDLPDAKRENICRAFREELPDADSENIGNKLAELFSQIIQDAAEAKRKSPKDKAENVPEENYAILTDKAPELTPDNADQLYFINPDLISDLIENEDDNNLNPFAVYLEAAKSYYSTKKTLLYAEKPYPFYDLFVCSDLLERKTKLAFSTEGKFTDRISNITITKLESETKHTIIEGIGGSGKSMLMTHLFLESAKEADETGKFPVFLTLKDYKDNINNVVDFIFSGLKEFDPNMSRKQVVDALQANSLILLFDGLDEIQSSLRDSFERDLEAFIKSYPNNTVVITSRPINSFISFAKFTLYDILPLTLNQATTLINKLNFWDKTAQKDFTVALKMHLYDSHYEFASNPLLLTIMLMSYSSFGEVPAKMHVFYSKAYETMARLHDATKGSYRRPLHTKLTPEEFAKFFSQFCARTYKDEQLEFTESTFSSYMKKVMKGSSVEQKGITPRDFLLDVTDNLCIMYRECDRYYFIHRSFQEYFAAVYFASEFDNKLYNVGMFFENMQHRSFSDLTFDMLYDMIPEKVERYIFQPYLDALFKKCEKETGTEQYWAFLEQLYPVIYIEECDIKECDNTPQSYLYEKITNINNLECYNQLECLQWPRFAELCNSNLPASYQDFLEENDLIECSDVDFMPETKIEVDDSVELDNIPFQYEDDFETPYFDRIVTEIKICSLRYDPIKHSEIKSYMEGSTFPLMVEYTNVKRYFKELTAKVEKENNSDDLFDD